MLKVFKLVIVLLCCLVLLRCTKDESFVIKSVPEITLLSPEKISDKPIILLGKIKNIDPMDVQEAIFLIHNYREELLKDCEHLLTNQSSPIFDLSRELYTYGYNNPMGINDHKKYYRKGTVGLDGLVTSAALELQPNEIIYYTILITTGLQVFGGNVNSFSSGDLLTLDNIFVSDSITGEFTSKYYSKENDIVSSGFCWNYIGHPTITDNVKNAYDDRNAVITCKLEEALKTGISHIRAFVEKKDGSVFYSDELIFDNRSIRGIYSVENFIQFCEASRNNYYKYKNEKNEISLFVDLDLKNIDSWKGCSGYFSDIFNGNGHIVKNIVLSKAVGPTFLFENISAEGIIKNLIISDINATDIKSSNLYDCEPAGFCAKNYGMIENCTLNGMIFCSRGFSGFCDENWGKIVNCTNNAYIESQSSCGIASQNIGGMIQGCTNNGDIKGGGAFGICSNNQYAEGLGREELGIIRDCVNKGNITGESTSAAFGYKNSGLIIDSKNEGVVIGTTNSGYSSGCFVENTGDIVSFINSEKISGSQAAGIVNRNVGNINQPHFYGTITTCINRGDIYGESDAGGLTTWNSSKIENSISEGNIYGAISNKIGGLSGYNKGLIIGCHASGFVNQKPSSASNLVGKNDGYVN